MESVYENFFTLIHFGKWSFIEAYNLPIVLRKWFTNRLIKHYEDEKEEHDRARKSSR